MRAQFLKTILFLSCFSIVAYSSEKKEICEECQGRYQQLYQEVEEFHKQYDDYKKDRNQLAYNFSKIEEESRGEASVKKVISAFYNLGSSIKDLYKKSAKSEKLLDFFDEKYKKNDLLQQGLSNALREDVEWHECEIIVKRMENDFKGDKYYEFFKNYLFQSFSRKLIEKSIKISDQFKQNIGDYYCQKLLYKRFEGEKYWQTSYFDGQMLNYIVDGCTIDQLIILKQMATPNNAIVTIMNSNNENDVIKKNEKFATTELEKIWDDVLNNINLRLEKVKN